MSRDHWKFTGAPFDGGLEPATFHAGGPQEEALARMEWLLEERQRCGLVMAAEGCGKSHLAAMAVRRLGGLGAETALLSLRGLAAGDWIELLLERLPLDPLSRAEPLRPWQKLENRLRENTLMERPTVLLFDDIDEAPADALDGIARLVGAAEPRFARTVVVATATPAGLSRVPASIRQRAALRIELSPWTEDDVAGFLAQAISRVGGDPDIFPAEAAATLARFAGGVPRTVSQLAQLSLAAAAGDGLDRVDAATVERAWRELSMAAAGENREAMVHDDDVVEHDAAAASLPPRVRVVRRLWG
jgi:type II secretory pathway predicted ATPase ExeA